MRTLKNMTLLEVAEILGVKEATMQRYESGEIIIDIYNLIKLANFFETSTDYLLGITDEPKPYPKKQINKN